MFQRYVGKYCFDNMQQARKREYRQPNSINIVKNPRICTVKASLARLDDQQALGILCLFLPTVGFTDTHHHAWLYRGPGYSNSCPQHFIN